MLVLITYDVSTETSAGRRRLQRVAKSVYHMVSVSRIQFSSVTLTGSNLLYCKVN